MRPEGTNISQPRAQRAFSESSPGFTSDEAARTHGDDVVVAPGVAGCVEQAAADEPGHAGQQDLHGNTISRFFTTVRFFTEAGLNLPRIFRDIALDDKLPDLPKKINPLPNDLLWLRGMDVVPRLMTADDMKRQIVFP